jgi:hypothetical protein
MWNFSFAMPRFLDTNPCSRRCLEAKPLGRALKRSAGRKTSLRVRY